MLAVARGCDLLPLGRVHRCRCLVAECLVGTLVVVVGEVAVEPVPRLLGARIILQIHLLILDRAPEPLREHVVERSPSAVHADAHLPPARSPRYCGLVKWLP